jgi:hypothetical protein
MVSGLGGLHVWFSLICGGLSGLHSLMYMVSGLGGLHVWFSLLCGELVLAKPSDE